MRVAGSAAPTFARRLATSSSWTSVPADTSSSTAPGPSARSIWNTLTDSVSESMDSKAARWPSSSRTIATAPESRMIHSIWLADDES